MTEAEDNRDETGMNAAEAQAPEENAPEVEEAPAAVQAEAAPEEAEESTPPVDAEAAAADPAADEAAVQEEPAPEEAEESTPPAPVEAAETTPPVGTDVSDVAVAAAASAAPEDSEPTPEPEDVTETTPQSEAEATPPSGTDLEPVDGSEGGEVSASADAEEAEAPEAEAEEEPETEEAPVEAAEAEEAEEEEAEDEDEDAEEEEEAEEEEAPVAAAPLIDPNDGRSWYVVHTYSGYENKAKQALEDRIRAHGMDEHFGPVLVPAEKVTETRSGGQKRTTTRKFFPGYMFVRMTLNDQTWHLVKNTPRVTGFVGGTKNPPPVPDDEVARITNQIREGTLKPTAEVAFEKGETVRVIEGPFMNFNGIVEEVLPEKQRVKVVVSILGRSTPVEFSFEEIEKT